jgi:1-acyl-sn-glycerol-3-phosphate acyltransferase
MVKTTSTITWLIVGGLVPVYFIVSLLTLFLGSKIRHRILISWGEVFTFLGRYLCRVTYEVIGRENLIQGPAIFASNHQSTWETLAFNVFLPQHIWILKRELIRIPIFGWTLNLLSPIAIDRSDKKAAVMQVLEQSVERVKDGFWIMVFPEGTRLPPGSKEAYKTGVARMAIRLNLPVVPIAHNAGHIMPRRSFWLYPGKVTVRIGKPIYPNNSTPEEFTETVRMAIHNELKTMGEL